MKGGEGHKVKRRKAHWKGGRNRCALGRKEKLTQLSKNRAHGACIVSSRAENVTLKVDKGEDGFWRLIEISGAAFLKQSIKGNREPLENGGRHTR